MNAESLYYLIHSLTPAQKANFSHYLSAGKGRSAKFKLLYDRMLQAKSYDDEKIRGKEFKAAAKYYQNRELLLDKIIQSMVFFSDQKSTIRSYVFKAMEVGAFDHGRRRLAAEIGRAEKEGDTDLLHYLHALKAKVQQAYRMELGYDAPGPGSSLEEQSRALHRLRALFRRVDQILKQGMGVGGDLAPASLAKELEMIPVTTDEAKYLALKIRSGIDLLKKEHEAAYQCQLDALAVLEKASFPLAQQMLAREYYLLTNMALRFDHFEVAEQAVMKFSLLSEVSSFGKSAKQQEMWTKAAIRVAYSRANAELMKEAMPHFDLLSRTARPEIYLLNLLLAATTFFVHNEYSQSLQLLETIRSFPKTQWREMYWATETLRLMIHSELGNVELCETIYRAAMHQAKQLGTQYPNLVTRSAMKIILFEKQKGKRELFDQFNAEMKLLRKDKNEEPAIDLMDFSYWFRSITGSISKVDAFLFRNNSNIEPGTALGT